MGSFDSWRLRWGLERQVSISMEYYWRGMPQVF